MNRAKTIKKNVPVEVLLDVLGFEVAKNWTGGGWTEAQCPIHDDDNPSASISPDGEYLVCFACGFKGDLFDILQRCPAVGVTTFPEALAWVQENLDIRIGTSKRRTVG